MEQMAGAGISGARLRELVSLLAAGHEYKFYSWPEWRTLRLEVLRLDRYECQHCKAAGRYRKGYIVHHVKHLRQRPDLGRGPAAVLGCRGVELGPFLLYHKIH